LLDHDNLEAFADGEAYDLEDPSDTGVAFYRALAGKAKGKVLELGCGTGRVAIPLAQAGFPVTGLDAVESMIAVARRKSAGLPARWVLGDARSFDLREQFHLIYMTGNVFQFFLTNADQAAVLAHAHAHLHADGLLAFETRNPRWRALAERSEPGEGAFFYLETVTQEHSVETCLDAQGRSVRISRTQRYDPVAQVLHLTGYKRRQEGAQEQTQITRVSLRYTFPQELSALLHCHGFSILRQYGDWNCEPLAETSPSIIVVCGKRIDCSYT
jgi:SAM-dependent methyltransferase